MCLDWGFTKEKPVKRDLKNYFYFNSWEFT